MERKTLIPGEYYSPAQIISILGLARSTVYEAVKRGDVETRDVGKRKVISGEDANAYFLKQDVTGEVVEEIEEQDTEDQGTTREQVEKLFAEEAKGILENGSAYAAHRLLDLWNRIDDILAEES